MKVVAKAALIVGAVAAVATGVGAIVGAAAFASATGIGLATVSAIGTVAGLTASVATAISPPKAAKGTIGGSQTDFKLDPNAGIPYLIGRTYSGGNIIHQDTWGQDNQYRGFVVTYSGAGTMQGMEAYQVDYSAYPVDGGGSVGGSYRDWMWWRCQLGTNPGQVITSPVAGFPGVGAADYKASGHTTGVLVLKFDVKAGKKYAGGVPKTGAVFIGERVYDPRQDSTFPGGNGPCRARQEETYVGGAAANNPWCHAVTWAIGRYANGRRVMGVGQRPSSIEMTTFVDAMNVADANGWTCGGVVYSIDDKWDVIRQLAQAGGGECLRLGARLAAVVNAPKVALATVTDKDLVGRASLSAALTYRDRLNGLIPRYRSEAHGWEMIPASVVRVAAYVAVDGDEKTREWPLPLVQDLKQAGQLAAYELVNRREFGPISLPLFIRFLGYAPGDALNLNINSMNLVNQLAIVRKRQLDITSGNVQLQLKSETTAKHAFALGHTSVAPPIPNLSVPDELVVAAPKPSDWSVAGGELENAGAKTPVIFLTGDVRNPSAEAILVEKRAAASGIWETVGTYPASTTRLPITAVAPNAAYYIGVSFVQRGVIGERLQLGPVGAGTMVAPDALYPNGESIHGYQPAGPGATAGAPAGSNVGGIRNPDGSYTGGIPAETIARDLVDLRDIIENYDPEGGGAAAAAAQAARDAAILARDNALAAERNAQAARDAAQEANRLAGIDAENARAAARSADGSAKAAVADAAVAKTKADEAGSSASAADAQRAAAVTARGGAEAARDQAATSETNARGSEASAATSSRTAGEARDAAGRSAQGAFDSQTSAAASSGEAGRQASAASGSAGRAEAGAGRAELAEGRAVTAQNNAAGSANTASAFSELSATSANRAAFGAINRHYDFAQGKFGNWPIGGEVYMLRPADHGQTVPPDGPWVYHVRGVRDVVEQPAIPGAWSGRVIGVTALCSTEFSDFAAGFGFFVYNAAGEVIQFALATAIEPRSRGYRRLYGEIRLAEGAASVLPWIHNSATPGELNAQVRVQSVYYRDVTEKADAADSARSAVTSASTATTKAGEAGNSATAANQSKLDAEAANGSAIAQAGAAAGSAATAQREAAAASRSAELSASYRDTADARARQANDSSVSASSAAARSEASASQSASLVGRGVNPNPVFANWPDGARVPVGWDTWGPYSGTGKSGASQEGGYTWDLHSRASVGETNSGWVQSFPFSPGKYIVTVALELIAGTYIGTGLYIYSRTAQGQPLDGHVRAFWVEPDTTGNINNNPGWRQELGLVRRFSFFLDFTSQGAAEAVFHVMSNWESFGGAGDKIVRLHSARVVPANQVEIESRKALPELRATLNEQAGTIAAVDGRSQAYWSQRGQAGSGVWEIEARAVGNPDGSSSSRVAIAAEEFTVANKASGVRKRVLSVVGSRAVIDGTLSATSGVFLGNGQEWAYQLQTKSFPVSDGSGVTFPVDLGAAPSLDFQTVGLAPLGPGETYRLFADGVTGRGFTARLRIIVPGQAQGQYRDASYAAGSGPQRQLDIQGPPTSADGVYLLNMTGTVRLNSINEGFYNEVAGNVTVSIWRYINGWTYIGSRTATVIQRVGGGGAFNVGWQLQESINLGQNTQYIGCTVESARDEYYNINTTGTVDSLTAQWTSQGAGSERSATPNGETAQVVVRP